MSVSWKRMYVDILPDTKVKLKQRAAELGVSMKALVAQLIEQECAPKKRATKKKTTRRKRRGSK